MITTNRLHYLALGILIAGLCWSALLGLDPVKQVVKSSAVDIVVNASTTSITTASLSAEFSTTTWEGFQKPETNTLENILTPLAYTVTQENGTERPYSSSYDVLYDRGIYVDVVSGEPLFSSREKYHSGTGWPSFVAPIHNSAVTFHTDKVLLSVRTEIRSKSADSHLGHVFEDGPKERGGKRYCINGAALRFIPESDMERAGYKAWIQVL